MARTKAVSVRKNVGKKAPVKPKMAIAPSRVPKTAFRSPAAGGVMKPHRYSPGVVALREVRRYQKSTELLIPKKSFEMLVREVCQEIGGMSEYRLTKGMLEATQTAAEDFLVELFRQATIITVTTKRVTLMPDDIRTVLELRNNSQ